jgi:hypothetical protein
MFGPSANVLFVLLLLEWLFGKLSAEPFVTGSVCTIVAYFACLYCCFDLFAFTKTVV